ncbi:MarR family winged helix-turn-helix transcriptional regulator [Paenibacillus cellulositrophicus]|uniref:MarR family winged helix-turn-helix transcriptional regulator n=1 Tax=Paenibacillus cellulositrophicus TaxID=562959 RepID=UPI001267198C|nr:MarR family transcriptional regulator [Paenibacillus cellulositrophicus]
MHKRRDDPAVNKGDYEDLYGQFVSRTSRALNRYMALHLKDDDITPEQWTVIKRLSEQDGITQKDLAWIADKDQANLTKILDILERKHLVRRSRNEEDRRSFLIYITEEGRKLHGEVVGRINRLYREEVLAGIPESELALFSEMLKRINRNIGAGGPFVDEYEAEQ